MARRRDVAEAAGRALDVRLELVERVVERRVPLVDEPQQRIEQPPAVVGGDPAHPAFQALKEPLVAGDETDVEQREEELGVAEVERGELGELASRTCWPTVSRRSHSGWSKAPTRRSSLVDIVPSKSMRRSMSDCRHSARRP